MIGWETAPYVGPVPRAARSNQHAPRRVPCPSQPVQPPSVPPQDPLRQAQLAVGVGAAQTIRWTSGARQEDRQGLTGVVYDI